MSRSTVTLVWMGEEADPETVHCGSVDVQDGVLVIVPENYGYSRTQPLRNIPLARLREWSEVRHG